MEALLFGGILNERKTREMNMVSIDTQKKLMYIPFVNIVNFIILFLNLRCVKVSVAGLMKAFVYILGYGFPVWFAFSAAARLFPALYLLFFFCTIYFGPLAVSYGSIKYQEKYL